MLRPLGRLRPGSRRDEAAGTQVDELERLASLHEKGVLSDEELAAGKARILRAAIRRADPPPIPPAAGAHP